MPRLRVLAGVGDGAVSAYVLGIDPGLAALGWVVVELLDKPTPRAGDLFASGPPIRERIVRAGTIHTEPARTKAGKQKGRKSDDQLRRIVEQAAALGTIVRDLGEDLAVMAAEAQSWPHPPEIETTAFLERDASRDRVRHVLDELAGKLEAGTLTVAELRRHAVTLAPPSTSLRQVEASIGEHTRRTFGVLTSSTMIGMSWGIFGCLAALVGVPVAQSSNQRVRSKLLGRASGTKEQILAALVDLFGEEELRPILELPKGKRLHASDALAAVVAALDHPAIVHARAAAHVDEDIDFG